MTLKPDKCEHTPGPWRAEATHYPPEQAVYAGKHEIALVYMTDGLDEPTLFPVEANARLIAAAPDMLAALQLILIEFKEFLGDDRQSRMVRDRIRAAIAKAKGARQHASDCAIYNAPALPIGPCDCGANDEPRVGEYRADYEMPTQEEIHAPDPELDDLLKNSRRVDDEGTK